MAANTLALQTGSGVARLLLDYLARRGIRPERVLAEAGLRAEDVQPDGRIARLANQRLWALAVERTREDALGLHVAQFAQPGVFGLVEFVARSAANLREAAHRLVELGRLNHDLVTLTIEEDEHFVRLVHAVTDGRSQPAPVIDFVVAYLTLAARQLAGRERGIAGISLARPRPARLAEYERILRAPLIFDARASAIAVERRVAVEPIPSADPGLHALLRRHARERLDALPPLSALSEQACAALRETLVSSGGRASEVARRLGVSERSLRRKLADAGTSHSALLEQVRRELALELEARSGAAQVDVAIELGYSSASAYRRAFRRWTGSTPSAWRERARGVSTGR